MFTQLLRKSATLLIIYAIFIVGIFILQFKNDLIISEKMGNLHISLLESISEDNTKSLKNRFSLMFNGLTFTGNDEKSAKARINSKERNVSLLSWEKISPLSCRLNFSDDISLIFAVSDDSPKAQLSIETSMPHNVSAFYLPYGFAAGATLASMSDSKLQVSNKHMDWELSASEIDSSRITFTQKDRYASYSYYNKARAFSFDMTLGIEAASQINYENTLANVKNNLINAFNQSQSTGTVIEEQETVSYVAAMAEKGKYNEALDTVPSSFKKGSSRTFLSAPYFDTLTKVNEALQLQLNSYANLIARANEADTYDIYGTKFIADYMCMHPGSGAIAALFVRTVAADFENISVLQASSILNVYNELIVKNPSLASGLKDAVQKCINKIESACTFDTNIIILSEKGAFLSVVHAVLAGDALFRYGSLIGNESYISAGRLIINSYLKDNASFDLRTLGELYPIIVHGNSYLPHFDVLAFDKGNVIWTWTCAEKVSYVNDNAGSITISIKFPLSYSHYLILNGIEAFKSIYIYDIPFRSDYRFETYNSSGYVYQSDFKSLLLKSRHKSEVEDVRLIYKTVVPEKTEESESSASTESSTETTE